jgi:formate dehydrogenase major subunit
MVRVTVDGVAHEFAPGLTILQALRSIGIGLTHVCDDGRLKPAGVCRLCRVMTDRSSRPVPACTTAVADGMVVFTDDRDTLRERENILRVLAWSYPPGPVWDRPDLPFHRALLEHGVAADCRGTPDPALRDESHPYLSVDLGRCVECYRCVRICDEVQGRFAWHVYGRGGRTRVRPAPGPTLLESTCVSCGACADTCPTGAIEDRSLRSHGPPEAWTRTTCPYCGVGCELLVGTSAGRIVTIRPAPDAPVNRGHACSKGRYAHGFVTAPDRVTTPLLREGGTWREATWDEAIGYVARRLGAIVRESGPDAAAVLGSARATNEENYLAQKFARVVLGTNNVDCCARVCHGPSAAGLKATMGTGAATGSFDDIERARTLLVCGANATENHPVVGRRILQAARRGATLIVIDPRRIELAEYATVFLRPRAGTNVPLLNALAHAVLALGLEDAAFVRDRLDGLDEFRAFVAAWTPERAAGVCGVDADDLRRAARLLATNGPASSFHGLGVTEHTQGTDGVIALANLMLLTGNVGRPGASMNPLRGQNNVQGSAHMGCEPGALTGYVPLATARARFERAWGVPLPAERGLDVLEMVDAARAGKLRALWTIGYDVLLSNPDAHHTEAAFDRLDLLVIQDLFLNETARRHGHVFFPVAASYEKDGTFMNGERRVQRVRRAVPPPPGVRTDWEVIRDVARAMGRGEGFAFADACAIWDEVRSVWTAGAGISYARLETEGGLQWPCPDETHPGTARLHGTSFTHGVRTRLRCVDYRPTPERTDDTYPLRLITGRTLHQFNAATMTMRTPQNVLRPTDVLDMSSEDAARLGVSDGEAVRVTSRYGEATLPARIGPAVRPGELFASFQTPAIFLNRVTGPHRDPETHTPEYKVTAVRVERV